MNDKRKKIIYAQAKRLDINIEFRFTQMVNEMIKQFGSFTTEDHELFTKYVEYENNRQANNH
jgi:hypothetical protein